MTRFLLLFGLAAFLAVGSASAQPTVGNVNTQDARLLDASCNQTALGTFRPECYAQTGTGNTAIYPFDAAWNAAAAFVRAGSGGAIIPVPASAWSICNNQQGLVIPQANLNNSGISVLGAGNGVATLSLQCQINRTAYPPGAASGNSALSISQAMLWMPAYSTAKATNMVWEDFSAYANGQASMVWDQEGLVNQSTYSDLVFSGAAGDGTSTATEVRLGNSAYNAATSWTYGSTFRNIYVGSGGTSGSGATFTISVNSGTGVPTVTVVNGGSGYSANTIIYLPGYPASQGPTPSFLTPTISGGVITGVTNPNSYTYFNGPATPTAHAYDPVYPIKVAVRLDNVSDSTFYDLQPTVGTLAALDVTYTGSGSNRFFGLHPCCFGLPVGVVENAFNNHYYSTEFDSMGMWGAIVYNTASPYFVGTQWLWNGSYAGAQAYLIASSSSHAFIEDDQCDTGLYQNAGGYQQFNWNFAGTAFPNTTIFNAPTCDGNFTFANQLSGSMSGSIVGTTSGKLAAGNDSRIIGTPVSVTASGTTQSGAAPLTGQFNLGTLSTGNTAFSLQAIVGEQNFVNTQPVGGLAALIFPLSGSASINGLANTASVSIPGGTSCAFRSTDGVNFRVTVPADPMASGAGAIVSSAMVSGTPYTIPSGTSVMLFSQTTTQAAVTITLPSAPTNSQTLELDNGTGQITATTFSPAISGWANGSTLTPNSTVSARYFTATSTWQRTQ